MDYCYHCMSELRGNRRCPVCGAANAEVTFQPHQLPPGTVLQGRYLLGRVLGKGAFGITYIGMDLNLRFKIAVKEYYPSICSSRVSTVSTWVTMNDSVPYYSIEGKEKFLQEARTLAMFRNTSGIVNIYDFFEANGTAYIVMEYLEGQTLKEVLKYRTFQPDEIFSLMLPVMDALSAVHEQNLIHRDISPDNLMLLPDNRLVLMDFGAARQYSLDNPLSMTIMVKHGYAPEEQYRNQGEVGPWTDVYALCATIYHCLTGVLPTAANQRMVYDDVLSPGYYGVKLTRAEESALKRGMAVNAKKRIQTMEDLKTALKLKNRPVTDELEWAVPESGNQNAPVRTVPRSETGSRPKVKKLWSEGIAQQQEQPMPEETPVPEQSERSDKAYLVHPRKKAGKSPEQVSENSAGSQPEQAAYTSDWNAAQNEENAGAPAGEVPAVHRNNRTVLIIAAVAVLCLVVGGIFAGRYLSQNSKYQKAETALESGNTDQAISLYSELAAGNFKDSDARLQAIVSDEFQTAMNQEDYTRALELYDSYPDFCTGENGNAVKYLKAKALYEAQNYAEALELFEELGDYSDSGEMLRSCSYALGTEKLAAGEYEDAAACFDQAGDYQDAAELKKQCSYEQAEQLYHSGSYADAASYYEAAGDYQDAADKFLACGYQQAMEQYEAGEYEEARTMFLKLGSYSDAREQADACAYQLAKALYDEGSYSEAKSAFEALGDYSDSAAMVNACSYQLAMEKYQSGDYASAKTLFEQLAEAGYSDAAAQVKKCSYQLALESYESGDKLAAYEAMLSASGYEEADTKLSEWAEELYEEARSDYQSASESFQSSGSGSFDQAKQIFNALGSYQNSANYLILISAFEGNTDQTTYQGVLSLISTEDAKYLLMHWEDYQNMFLKGNWKTSGGSYYFKVSGSDYATQFNLPCDDPSDGNKFAIIDGVFSWHDLSSGTYNDQFKFTIIDENTMDCYCYHDGTTYRLYRQ